ncbi:MAG: hypothetical protein Q7V15_00355 [Phenylobacterium sp.]|uniref:hypothetical protein n=1 Tax=Phenylobacterium sp. TaxID=1871053 RepID=UPI002727A1F5|nr:hypothetical protein [Phenylobacterium sp.]MDO8899787.1 hypothetical protein [Phenylobacterium sp.]MDP2213714.1 hypothetical protein [Phenylobacterium sp.]
MAVAELEVERALERMFARATELPDADAFVNRVQRRLDRGWAARRILIGGAGVVGGVIGASQLIMSNLFSRAEAASSESARVLTSSVRQIAPQADWLFNGPAGIEAIWLAAGLAVVAMGLVLTRIIEEI